jgi:DNA-binding response OmpR family regulator
MKTQQSVLVIDDEQIICDSCHRILSNEDVKVDTDTDAQGGYQKALENNYDLILLDLNMRELDGIQLLSKLRKDKPDVPVIIITGYPTKETKEESKILGVSDYILKPFKPYEILDPVKNILAKSDLLKKQDMIDSEKFSMQTGWVSFEKNFWFFKNGWLQKGTDRVVRVGGQFPVLLNESIESIKLLESNEKIFRGFPLAEISYANDIKVVVPSPVTGQILEINQELIKNPSLFEEDNDSLNWIATILPDNLEEDLKMCETRNVVFFSNDTIEKSDYFKQLTNLGYIVNKASSVDEAAAAISTLTEKVIVFDAKSFSENGPQNVEALKAKASDAKVIVFNVTEPKLEMAYREKKIFFYSVDPISSKEVSSILYGAFCFSKDREKTESQKTTFLPPAINRIQITNKHSQKVSLLAYDNVLQFNKGAGYLLIEKLHESLYPIEIDHTRNICRMKDAASAQKVSKEKLLNDKVIIIYKDDMGRIPGSVVRTTETFENANGPDNVMVKIAVQPIRMDADELVLDINTTKAVAELIEREMTNK